MNIPAIPPLALMLDTSGSAHIPLSMLIIFVSAKLMAELFERVNQPGIVGEILAGVLIGPSVLGLIGPSEFLTALADLGAMFLLFRVGLDVRSSELLQVGGTATVVACSGVVVPFLFGWGILTAWGASANEAIFVGASMVATSVGITAQVLSAKGLLHAISSKIILAAAVIDDVLGLLVLAVVSSLTHGQLNIPALALTAVMAVGFTLVIAKWGTHAMGRVVPHVDQKLRVGEAQFALAMSVLFALSVAAVYIGVAAIVGAFLAGLALAESTGQRVRDLAHGVTELLVPFFLAGIGLHVSLAAFSSPRNALLAVVILLAAVVSKFIGCGLGALGLGKADALRVGVGMIPRGEVGMVVAQIGLGFGIITQNVYGVVVFMSVATTIVAPPLIKIAFRGLLKTGQAEAPEEVFRIG
uniref:Sodium/hydrogen exchanger n=1 Tax=Solibacter usitatus (strain Ellin6076) TaxID=234267 RepID=Q01V38_SOLUE